MPGTQTVHLQLTVEGTQIEAAVPLPAGPVLRRVLLPTLQGLTDTIVRIAETSAAAAGEKISCKKGCDACCRQMVPVSPTEAHALAALLEKLPAAQASGIRRRFHAAVEALGQSDLRERLARRQALAPAELQQLDRDYFAAGIGCPFLQNHACSIHPQRPLACREFVVSSPARECRTPGSGRVRQIPMPAKVSVALAAGDEQPWLPLVLAVEFAAAHPEPMPRKAPDRLLEEILRAL